MHILLLLLLLLLLSNAVFRVVPAEVPWRLLGTRMLWACRILEHKTVTVHGR